MDKVPIPPDHERRKVKGIIQYYSTLRYFVKKNFSSLTSGGVGDYNGDRGIIYADDII